MNAIIPFAASVLICSFACDSPADTPQIRVSVSVKAKGNTSEGNIGREELLGYVASVAITDGDGRLVGHFIVTDDTIDEHPGCRGSEILGEDFPELSCQSLIAANRSPVGINR